MLSLLLHMHQPDYRDPRTGAPSMPWVRLHATRGYRDVARAIAAAGARVTVNLVPSLLDQLDHYAGGGGDAHLDVARRDPASLEPWEVGWMLDNFFHGAPSAFSWFPAWGALRARRDAGERFDAQALRDVQVWSQLAWFGFTALEDFPLLRELRARGHGFTEAEKHAVLDLQVAIARELPSLYRALPDVAASPYYHPILPLLVDTAHARRCMPHAADPGFRHPEDALEQLRRGRLRVESWAGRNVRGLWPSEGSVSPEVADLAADAGFRWMATDEGVLRHSTRSAGDHHQLWDAGRVRVLFRDHALSDRVGFVYGGWRGEEAAEDLAARVRGRNVLLALDGENPWEGYADAGAAFLRGLFRRVPTRTCSDWAEEAPRGRLHALHTGSWINADFRIWIGHREDVEGWTLLREARDAWEARGRPEAARESLLAAEGSDWFWWYGDEFDTAFAGEFDRLFRAHLAHAWAAMGGPVPDALARPIKRPRVHVRAPVAPLPATDGDDWFAWAGAGRVDVPSGAMAPVRGAPRVLLYGERGGALQIRALPPAEGWSIRAGDARVPLHAGRARLPLPDGALELGLEGPDGTRLPAEGTWRLPWSAPQIRPL